MQHCPAEDQPSDQTNKIVGNMVVCLDKVFVFALSFHGCKVIADTARRHSTRGDIWWRPRGNEGGVTNGLLGVIYTPIAGDAYQDSNISLSASKDGCVYPDFVPVSERVQWCVPHGHRASRPIGDLREPGILER